MKEIFTDRQLQILKLIAKGKQAKEIAYDLKISRYTVAVHKTNMYSKAGVHSAVELVIFAFKNKILVADMVESADTLVYAE